MGWVLQPGEKRVAVVAWTLTDPAKADDPAYWLSADEVGFVARLNPTHPYGRGAGTPKGRALEEARRTRQAPTDGFPDVRIAFDHLLRSDRGGTHVIVHQFQQPERDREAEPQSFPWPPEVEELRQAWAAAQEAGDPDEPALREQLDEEMRPYGVRSRAWNAFAQDRAVEIAPGIWVQDERAA